MPSITIKIPEKKYDYLKDDNIFQSVIIETIADYIEKKQDEETKKQLSGSKEFQKLNSKLEEKLGKL